MSLERARSDLRRLPHSIASIITVALLFAASAGGLGLQTLAQSDDNPWTEPVNLSRCGAASEPVLVTGPEGVLQVFWWDQFDGIMTTSYDGAAWSSATQASIVMTAVVTRGEEAEIVFTPLEEMPSIAGGSGYAHALWRGEPDEETGIVPLMHSRLVIGVSDWSGPRAIGESALVWRMATAPDGVLHLIYIRAEHSDELPAGVYHMRSTNGGSSWSAPQALYETAYFRLLDPEETHFWVATGAEGEVYAAWDDPRLEKSFLARSLDGGVSWEEAQIVGDPDDSARRARVISTHGEALLLWETSRAATGCALYQQRLVTAREAMTATQALTTTEATTATLTITPTPIVHVVRQGDTLAAIASEYSVSVEALQRVNGIENPQFLEEDQRLVIPVNEEGDGARPGLPLPTTWSAPESVLEDLRECPEAVTAHWTEEGEPMLMMGGGSGSLTAVVWDGAQWSKPKSLSLSFEHPELGRQVTLESLQTTVVDGAFAIVGLGQNGDVWTLESEVEASEWAFAPPSPWSEPVDVSRSQGVPGRPAVAVDSAGWVHLLWSEAPEEGVPGSALYYARRSEDRWSRPARVLQSPEGKAEEPALVAVGDRLHALWSGAWNGAIYHSWAYLRDAYVPDGWSEPLPLPMVGATGGSPDVLVDAHGTLHVVYAVPLNEGRGIYYVRSDDRGESWSEAQVIFDATAAGWVMVDRPTLAMDRAGTLHVAWVRGSLDGPFPPQGIFYARSTDGGGAWSESRAMAEGTYDWPRMAAPRTGQAHLLWNEGTGGGGWLHRWSADYGAAWSYQQEVRGFRGVAGPVGLTTDGAGTLHLVGLGRNEAGEPALLYTAWHGSAVSGATLTTREGRWGEQETFRLESVEDAVPGAAAALAGGQGWLSVAFRADIEGEEGLRRGVLHAGRSMPIVEAGPEPSYTPMPTVAPTPSPMPTPTPTPRPTVPAQTPEPGLPVLSLGPIALPITAIGGLAVATLIVVGVLVGRGLWLRRR